MSDKRLRKLHVYGFQNLCPFQILFRIMNSRNMRWEKYGACIGEMKNAHIISGIKPLMTTEKPKFRWESNIKMDLKRM
jgi:hypothetical protein